MGLDGEGDARTTTEGKTGTESGEEISAGGQTVIYKSTGKSKS